MALNNGSSLRNGHGHAAIAVLRYSGIRKNAAAEDSWMPGNYRHDSSIRETALSLREVLMASEPYENFPFSMVLPAILVSVSIYALGAAVLSGFGTVVAGLYLLYCLGVEIHVMKMSCVDCWYYGKWCAFGRGKIAPLLFKQGDRARFASRCITWKELLPDMLVVLIPLAGGGVLLVRDFSGSLALMLLALTALSFGGNYLVRGRIACKYCRQRELGCPAEQFFSKQRAEG
jgi:hypothetical protein